MRRSGIKGVSFRVPSGHNIEYFIFLSGQRLIPEKGILENLPITDMFLSG
jgi:hypothetical protein